MLDYKLHNQEEGQDYLVLIHGLGGNSKIFYKQLKQYKQQFNVIAIELPGHGKSPDVNNYFGEFTSKIAAREVLKTLDHLNVKQAHFVGVSLGTIIIHDILQIEPHRVISTVLAGTVTRFSTFSKLLLFFGNLIKGFTPYMWIYSLFARIMMPKSNHKEARLTFVKEAVKMNRQNFLGWYELTYTVEDSYRNVQEKAYMVPKLYVSGSEDHLFINPLKKDIENDSNATLHVIEHCGHVCNIEKPKEFNKISLEFLSQSKDALKQAT